ncbi:hypothetical protein GJU03_01920 [Enterobacteriaceae endosymbiont of Donacia bicoloricornis]|uniref:S4 domain-containing protein n=1 Tax=Enterobacteriaceae endosymbiont of Donacia bicoloricornis TaxID=2675772 RepID=UPI00144A2B69|nr:S4 domain-containing protein [Enterobacteriaceae endosymbiont of Donacia bicoloricornis]QJC37889.1 hypothetical protein GJU03_01920 [Enterobacteriaceae endosymbiont of Donacia bicoloricornis]
MKYLKLTLKVCSKYNKQRLDVFLTKKIIQFSRSQIKKIIINNNVKINNNIINIPKKKFF